MITAMGHFLQRLRSDVAGNTLAIVGAALIPITAMIGSGLDVSRAYMAKSRLQSACDAASLAARRVMRNDALTADVKKAGEDFFKFNFHDGIYQTEPVTPLITRPDVGLVRVEASTRIPTSVMKIFGFGSLPLSVSCDASLNFVNTDVVLVLDVTGSMLNDINDNPTNVVANRKITALRDAVMALYDELAAVQTQLQSQGLRLRYGVVPYSSAVNVGNLVRGANANYITSATDYQSREAYYNTPVYVGNTPTSNGPYWEYYRGSSSPQTSTTAGQATTGISQANCLRFMQNQSFTGFTPTATNPTSGGPPPTATVVASFPHDGAATAFTTNPNNNTTSEWGWSGAPVNNSTSKSCRRRRTDTTTTYTTRYAFTHWVYRPAEYNTSAFKAGTAVTIATNTGGSVPATIPQAQRYYTVQQLPGAVSNVATTVNTPALTTATSTWNGCIEERSTANTITAGSSYTIPPNAYDLNINQVPNNDTTRWRPMWPVIAHRRNSSNDSLTNPTSSQVASFDALDDAWAACPSEARRLQAWTRPALLTYINNLNAVGGTYHDIGMIWGARMISSGGIFADSPDEFNQMPVNRHIIFMTDGDLATNFNSYSSYGIEMNDRRVTGTYANATNDAQRNGRHLQRFKMICNATKNQNVSIWVIAFGTTLQPEMIECASNANQASTSNNRDQLIARFRQIGNQIGALRLTK